MAISLKERWRKFRSRRFDSTDLEEFLEAGHSTFDPRSFAGQFGRLLVCERIERKQLPLPLEEAVNLPTTRRIDGILPLLIPSCRNVDFLVGELLEEGDRNGLPYPTADRIDAFRSEVALCYLAVLHRRFLRTTQRLQIEMKVECPHSALSGRKEQFSLMGTLPLGGIVTLFTSHLRATEWTDLDPAAPGHARALVARRREGRLRLEKPANSKLGE